MTGWFSVTARSQVHCPAGRDPGGVSAIIPPIATNFRIGDILHEHRAPEVAFSVAALLQVQWRALSLPQEHLACAAQAQMPSPEVLQQVEDG